MAQPAEVEFVDKVYGSSVGGEVLYSSSNNRYAENQIPSIN